ncbi:chemotaxis protein : Chemotaxis response regulator protein-glutamate methylesterase OS=Herbaspirillum sp. CF444 GN=cheB PE=3 SV=1: Response_reg: CheB_methylest [Gemmata massiliana]|uniref:Protein-glutamate methylesterase/protein-glutamine glutaminase n=1 Tax=Gemmata massiliana TaxID=1210884 RepID=A0A6P2CZH1_9BACT|nr:chemotaxis-specific protein-glutamate methyltransferase CheB [Gemmata massiliana]VTR92562.1 chemotaxis protein : Chemotaxis response regulator protein-glutamate methylesterase OS=Herbaspirillum sp. CF444 GN=cheB PE=3 SV=1: Response_reg: CheB_methylest [Gemmata massiliana]
MKKLRVLVVEDSLTVRKYLVERLQADPELEVVAEAGDGKLAIELCERLRPDVVTLDMMLPVMSGLSATEYIMAYCPTPIVIVSASTNRGELFRTYEALAAGALDVIEKPLADTSTPEWERNLVSTIKVAARVKVITHPRGRLKGAQYPSRVEPILVAPALPDSPETATRPYRCAAVGVSTGGPQALAALLGALPVNFPLPLLIVMHIGHTFGGAFAEWLADQSAVPVSVAVHGQPLPGYGEPGAVLAPPDRHLVVRGGHFRLTNEPEVHSCRPAVDVLFQSVAQEIGPRAIGVLMTGMGRDGARGLLAMRSAGAMTLAQDEESSVVFGMPREAILLGAAQRVLPLDELAPTLIALGAAGGPGARKS